MYTASQPENTAQICIVPIEVFNTVYITSMIAPHIKDFNTISEESIGGRKYMRFQTLKIKQQVNLAKIVKLDSCYHENNLKWLN